MNVRTMPVYVVSNDTPKYYTVAVAATANDWLNDNGQDGLGWHVSFTRN